MAPIGGVGAPQILHIAGWASCGFYKRAAGVLDSLSLLFPQRLRVVNHCYPSRADYRAWLIDGGFRSTFSDARAHSHSSSPFVWFGATATDDPDPRDATGFVGGCDDTLGWCRGFCAPSDDDKNNKKDEDVVMGLVDDDHTADHGYDYDLVVIGGGSGGLAASKEAAAAGAKVAVLDFVKPSPQGATWGLGGTCVNVGCIPKKLMHTAASLRESLHQDARPFGIVAGKEDAHSWSDLRTSVQNHVRGLNFKYRVALRENEVTYLNKLGRFVDAHTLDVTDKKGVTTRLTASRFLVAVGGRPAPLDCEGGELAVSSDDVFSLADDPGKVLCVGASYISLECAGFLAGLGRDTTVAVRSILLRGFDRECAELVGNYMEEHGNVKFKRGVVPTKLERPGNLRGGKGVKVTFSDGSTDEYDTVLAAVGRTADTAGLGLDKVGVKTNPKNGKIVCTEEQTNCPNIYAIGDVMEGCPELTPVAIQAGLSLARRLFAAGKEAMDYVNVCTTVFTPIEYAAVGLSEEDAKERYGACTDALEVYHKRFTPLEWSLAEERGHAEALVKVIVDKRDDERVIGVHYVGPNAGEIMQGYGVAVKMGMKYKDLQNTVGIHPTSSEEIVTVSVTKSSGKEAAAGGC